MVISETGAQGHILHPAVRPGKKLLRTVNPKLLHIIGKTNLHLLFEKITEIGRIHLRRICRILEADLLFIMFPDKLQRLLQNNKKTHQNHKHTTNKKNQNTGISFFPEFFKIFDLFIPDWIFFKACCLVQFLKPLYKKPSVRITILTFCKDLLPELFRLLFVLSCFQGRNLCFQYVGTFRQNTVRFLPAFKIKDLFFLMGGLLHQFSGLLVSLTDSFLSHADTADTDAEIAKILLAVPVANSRNLCQPLLHG